MVNPTTMRELKYPCSCSSSIERFRCKENCDHVTQKQWIQDQPSKWIVFREFDSEDEAKEYAEFFGLTKFIWKIEKR
jgi:hypothetical protein